MEKLPINWCRISAINSIGKEMYRELKYSIHIGTFEDDFDCTKVEYVSSLEGIYKS